MEVWDSGAPPHTTPSHKLLEISVVSALPVAVASVVGLAAFLYPFILPVVSARTGSPDLARAGTAPLVFAAVSLLSVVLVVVEMALPHAQVESAAKVAALLGAIVAVDATLRLVPSLGGASPIFFLIIMTGVVFGPRLGFLTGSMTLLLSALLTGGIGPWLPYQMLGAGWVGLGAGWLPRLRSPRRRLVLIALYGAVSAFGYGIVLNLYAWPFAAPGVDEVSSLFWQPGLGLGATVHRYAGFYVVTSLGHDLLRAAGNAALIVAFGAPVLATLERARRRLSWNSPAMPSALAGNSAVSRER